MAFWKKPPEPPPSADSGASESPSGSAHGTESGRHSALEEELLRRFGRVRSALGPGTVIQGKLSFDSPVRIDGKLAGEIFSSQTLLIGQTGLVEAKVEAPTVIVLGRLVGGIQARERIEVLPGAEVEGALAAPILVIHEGAYVQGNCSMRASSAENGKGPITRKK